MPKRHLGLVKLLNDFEQKPYVQILIILIIMLRLKVRYIIHPKE